MRVARCIERLTQWVMDGRRLLRAGASDPRGGLRRLRRRYRLLRLRSAAARPGAGIRPRAVWRGRSRRRAPGPARGSGLRRLGPALWLAGPLLAALLLPLAVVPLQRAAPAPEAPPAQAAPSPPAAELYEQPPIAVYLSQSGQIETLPLEDYVTGVVAAEMPASFQPEALKAQAIAARTFIVRRLLAGDVSGVPAAGAIVTDTVAHQAYLSQEALEEKFVRAGRADDLAKLRRAVLETRGSVMVYNGEPITASFFAASGGYTENSEDYWSAAVPYLRSVASPWEEKIADNYEVTVTFAPGEMLDRLGVTVASTDGAKRTAGKEAQGAQASLLGKGESRATANSASASCTANGAVSSNPSVPAGASVSSVSGRSPATAASGPVLSASAAAAPDIRILSHTAGGRVKEISIGGIVFSGREVREKLGLRSSQFVCRMEDGEIAITTYGNGHGVGMSQWGADGMAREGETATRILKHYYTGISFAQVSTLLKK